VGKGRFDDEKTEKGRKKAAIRGQVPRKQGLKRTEKVMPPIERPLSEGKFQENKD